MRGNGGIIGIRNSTTAASASGVYDLYDQQNNRNVSVWPFTKRVLAFTPDITSIDETTNNTVTLSVNVQGYAVGTTLYWTVNQVSGTVNSADFTFGYTGSVQLSSGDYSSATAIFSIIVAEDYTPDGTDVFNVQLREGSTSGTIISTSANITISDTSTTAPIGIDVTTAFVAIDEFINNDNINNTSANFSVSELQVSYSGTAPLILAHKTTSATTYYSDTPVACIQILDATGSTVLYNWWFGSSADNQGFTTTTTQVSAGTTGISVSPATADGYTYSTIVVGTTANKFNLATSTASAYTGTADGIANPGSTPMTLGEKTTSQSLGTYYIYRETSGALLNYATFAKSPSITWSAGWRVRIAYNVGNYSVYPQDSGDVLFIGIP